ncbi:DUF3108 domain-containing protein [Nitrosomonas sp. HPC101]|uniref:DUF3108 domain-containing protein n=1 Tax=Nitrosomonas sp. HPC101 TaxID=1658667 RepID=UPI00136DBBD0|nr:DUF3108 domain-containing protein [Nitrosomonas sp. HPC101]MXS85667.1 DUF3108 domain-containing protein [Nitrosomonas sp. HPC101]
MKFSLFIALFFWAGSIACATDLPERIDIDYTLSGLIGQGKAHETLLVQNKNGIQHYTLDSEISASGLLKLVKRGSIIRHSEGTIIPNKGMQPLHFSDQRGEKPARTVEFDWNEARIIYRRKGQEITENLPEGTLDELSVAYHFIFTAPPQQTVSIHETDYRVLHLVRYAVTQETLDTPIGKLATIVLTKQQEPGDSFRKKIWLATDHHMLPVRIISTEKHGMEVDQIVTKIDYKSPADSAQ